MTMEETFQKIVSSEELQRRFGSITDMETLKSFLDEVGCQETPERFLKYLHDMYEGEISEDEAEAVAGGVQASSVFQRVYHDYVRPVIEHVYYF